MRKAGLFFMFIILMSTDGFSQYLNGRARNESGSGASKVDVRFTRAENKVETDKDGNFRILAKNLPDTLVFTAEGVEPYKVVITEKNLKDPDFEVVLLNRRSYMHDKSETSATMEEVVVTSLGVKKRAKEVGYATSRISGDELAGKASGVTVYGSSSGRDISVDKMTYARPVDDRYFLRDTNIFNGSRTAAASRLLTAGEVNDFTKWKMWEDYSENDFKGYTRFWGINTSHRYTVQLTDRKFNAVVNSPVYLVDAATNDTVWRAITDNTGKAELWAGFLSEPSAKQSYYVVDSKGNRFKSISEFSNGVNLLTIDGNCNVSNEVDVAFVVDATGSMGDEIEYLKLELENVIRGTMEKYHSLSFRAASVFYRDNGDEYVTKNVAFNEDLLKAVNFIKLQQAGGGGDYPEAVDAALSTALDSLKWNPNARTRLLFLVLDAPPHNEAKERVQQLIVKAAAKGVRIIPIACSGTDKSTEFFLRSMALATNGTYTFLTNNSGIGNAHIEPTTDKYEIELLSDLLPRLIGQFIYAKDCSDPKTEPDVVHQPDNVLSVKIYPNPTSGQFVIETKKDIKEIFIADFTGKLLMRIEAGDKKGIWHVDIGQYPAGTYLVRYITADNKWGAEKIVLVRN